MLPGFRSSVVMNLHTLRSLAWAFGPYSVSNRPSAPVMATTRPQPSGRRTGRSMSRLACTVISRAVASARSR